MFTRLWLILALSLSHVGCYTSEETGFYKPFWLPPKHREPLERLKREFLQLEDLEIGNGPIAALGRKVTADIIVRYSDGTLVYDGPAISYFGMQGYVFIHNNVSEGGMLSTQQRGIMLGLNGMAVGGRRRITIHPKLVCERAGKDEANLKASCSLIYRGRGGGAVRKQKLIVEAKLTGSCIPVHLSLLTFKFDDFWCRSLDTPRRDPSAPIWRIYQAPPPR